MMHARMELLQVRAGAATRQRSTAAGDGPTLLDNLRSAPRPRGLASTASIRCESTYSHLLHSASPPVSALPVVVRAAAAVLPPAPRLGVGAVGGRHCRQRRQAGWEEAGRWQGRGRCAVCACGGMATWRRVPCFSYAALPLAVRLFVNGKHARTHARTHAVHDPSILVLLSPNSATTTPRCTSPCSVPTADSGSGAGAGVQGDAAAEAAAAAAAPPLVLPGDVLDTLEVFVLNFQELAHRSRALQVGVSSIISRIGRNGGGGAAWRW